MSEIIKMLRYNTGTDKRAFVEFKDRFDAVIFNATIVAYSASAVADLVSVYANQYIIDPQTHILQHDISAISSLSKKTGEESIKKSVRKYLEQMPTDILDILEKKKRSLNYNEIYSIRNELVEKVYDFETQYVSGYIQKKEYDRYLSYAAVDVSARLLIAPYFMLKRGMSNSELEDYIKLNRECLDGFIQYNKSNKNKPVAAQLVVEKSVLERDDFIDDIINSYNIEGYEYIFIWIDDFSSWDVSYKSKMAFYKLIEALNRIGKKPMMTYGGYDSILMCNVGNKARLYGVAQSVGYGEQRPITPVGGGLPVNKYYFGPIHKRLRMDEALFILVRNGYFSDLKTDELHAKEYYEKICNCTQCKEIIGNNINNFNLYNESTPYLVKGRYGDISRNRPTTEANFVAACHFLHYKCKEWDDVLNRDLPELLDELLENYELYENSDRVNQIKEWCEIIAR